MLYYDRTVFFERRGGVCLLRVRIYIDNKKTLHIAHAQLRNNIIGEHEAFFIMRQVQNLLQASSRGPFR